MSSLELNAVFDDSEIDRIILMYRALQEMFDQQKLKIQLAFVDLSPLTTAIGRIRTFINDEYKIKVSVERVNVSVVEEAIERIQKLIDDINEESIKLKPVDMSGINPGLISAKVSVNKFIESLKESLNTINQLLEKMSSDASSKFSEVGSAISEIAKAIGEISRLSSSLKDTGNLPSAFSGYKTELDNLATKIRTDIPNAFET